MVNEFVYCPRLFHLEWVQGQFASSDDVEEGLYVHRVVDRPGGSISEPDVDTAIPGQVARSVWVTSTRLRVTAKIDIVETGSEGRVTPVDYKKGHPDPDGQAWPSDVAQSVLQVLALRDAGYQSETAEIWYAETRQRVRVTVDNEAEDRIRGAVDCLWQVASEPVAPPPLVDSPKCPRCSLVGICLPDEINTLSDRRQLHRQPRRIVPADRDPRPVYVEEQGATIGVRGGRLEARKDGTLLDSVRLIDVGQLCIRGNVSMSAQVMRELFSREVPVCWFSYGGWFAGLAEGLPGKNVDLRHAQFTATSEARLSVAQRMVQAKIRNSRTLLRRNARDDVAQTVESLAGMATSALAAQTNATLLGIEGAAARVYFSRFTTMVSAEVDLPSDPFDDNGRSRRPPPDPINAMLSFTYALLVKDLTVTAHAVGFDPYFGIYHRPRFGRPALALDLAEEFRPLVAESTVLQVINNREIGPQDFRSAAGACQLTESGRKVMLRSYERRMHHEIKHPTFGYRVTYRRALEVQCRILAAYLLGELDSYAPFVTR
jgi:CRISPR-associated protein Cas1